MNTDVHDENPDAPRGVAPYEPYTPESDTGDASDVVVDVTEITEEPASPTSPTSVDTVLGCLTLLETLEREGSRPTLPGVYVPVERPRLLEQQTVERECSHPPSLGETTVSNEDIMASLLRLHTEINELRVLQNDTHNTMQFELARMPYELEQGRLPPFVGGWSQPPMPDPAHTHGRGGARARGGRGRNSRRTPANYAYADTECS